MMRRVTFATAVFACVATNLAAQLPPSIGKPIDAARKAAAATNAAVQSRERAKAAELGPQAAEAAAAAQSRGPGAPATAKGAVAAAAPARAGASGKPAISEAAKAKMQFYREVYSWNDDGLRDPFLSLLATSEIRPLLSDLVLIGVIYDLSGRNSVASLLDASSSEMYRVKVGNIIGRMKVAKIGTESITLNIDEFGFSRQETLLLDRSRKAGNAPGRRP